MFSRAHGRPGSQFYVPGSQFYVFNPSQVPNFTLKSCVFNRRLLKTLLGSSGPRPANRDRIPDSVPIFELDDLVWWVLQQPQQKISDSRQGNVPSQETEGAGGDSRHLQRIAARRHGNPAKRFRPVGGRVVIKSLGGPSGTIWRGKAFNGGKGKWPLNA